MDERITEKASEIAYSLESEANVLRDWNRSKPEADFDREMSRLTERYLGRVDSDIREDVRTWVKRLRTW